MRQIKQLIFHTYDAATGEWDKSDAGAGDWPHIELAVRSLDPSRRPELEVIFEPPLDDYDGNLLLILGGKGNYLITGTNGNGRWLQYFDERKNGGSATVTTAGEGFATAECYVCTDLTLVVRHFVESNSFLPDVEWETTWDPTVS